MQDTRERLVRAARRLFAERGFRNATVREIAARAECNLASINYYFRSKEALYQEVLKETFSTGSVPERMQDVEGQDPKQRLSQFIRHMTDEFDSDIRADRARLLAWETLAPTGFMDTSPPEVEAHLAEAAVVVRAFCGRTCEPEFVLASAYWLLGQCMVFRSSFTVDPRPDSNLCERLIRLSLEAIGTTVQRGAPASQVLKTDLSVTTQAS